MTQKQRKITRASVNYLLEFSAIPAQIRTEYLDLLLRRKNALSQKNVLLLQTIYKYVEENILAQWDSNFICKELYISSPDTLNRYKSRLLQGLREYYFKWQANRSQVEFKHNIIKKTNPGLVDSIKLNMDQARKMWEVGLRREAIKSFKKIAKTQIGSSTELSLMFHLFEIYEYHAHYYTNFRKTSIVKDYINKLKEILTAIRKNKTKISESELILLEIKLEYRLYFLSLVSRNGKNNAEVNNRSLEKVYRLSKKIESYDYLFRVLYSLASYELNKNNFNKAKEYCTEGYETAKARNHHTIMYTFASFLYSLKTKCKGINIRLDKDKILEFYKNLKKTAPLHSWTGFLENAIVLSYYSEKRNEIITVFSQLINSSILRGDFPFAIYSEFKLKSEIYHNMIVSHFKENVFDKNIIEIDRIETKYLEEIEKTCNNTLTYHKKGNNPAFILEVQELQLIAKFFNEDSFDFDGALHIVKKMEWLKKEKKRIKLLKSTNTFELLKLGFEMLEFDHDHKKLLNRYELKFRNTVEDFKNKPQGFTLTDYAIISSLARRLRCKEITAIVKDLYHWLEAHHPEILEPVLRVIEERESKIKVIDGSKQTAA